MPLRNNNGNRHESAAALVCWSDARDEDPMNSNVNTYANISGISPRLYVQNEGGEKCNTYANTEDTVSDTEDIVSRLYEIPVPLNESQYENVAEHRSMEPAIGNPNAMLPLYEGVGYSGSSASSSLFYQYVPSKVRTLL